LILRAVVNELLGRIVAVQPETQIVEPIVAWVTAGLRAPGVWLGSGSPGSRSAELLAIAGGAMPVAVGMNDAPALAAVSSSESAFEGLVAADGFVGEAIAFAEVLVAADGLVVEAIAFADGLVTFGTTNGVVVAPAAVPCDAVEPDAQPAMRRAATKVDAEPRNQ
jgi:hypothetical protein